MKIGTLGMPCLAFMAALCLHLAPAEARPKPPESASKIKKVLLYNKVGGWTALDGIASVKAVFSNLGKAKGFELVQLAEDINITLAYLKQFQVIVWNNNTNGGASVPSTAARQAILDYVDQGGGWMLICNAGDHQNMWPGLAERMGTTFASHGQIGKGEVVLDGAASAHGELKWMVQGFPEVFQLNDVWMSFKETVRPLPGVTVVATSRGGPANVIPTADGSEDNVYIWAREINQGRFLYNALGFGNTKIMEQQDSIVPKLYWENLRYAAGDYQNGCATPSSPGLNSAARVHVESMCATARITAAPAPSHPVALKGGRQIRLAYVPTSPFTIRVCDIRGANVWERSLPAGTGEILLDYAIKPGVYLFEISDRAEAVQQCMLIP